ncbi:MAG: tRNA (adenosine(37)-N6)-threonylcarbamoyltransferase complex dimerization subunit type 1 TsaB [Nannocystaceae bacterium]
MSAEDRTGWLLALDASTPRAVIVLGRVGADGAELVVADDEDDGPNQASGRLMPRIERALAAASIAAAQLSAIACGRGPGTFTGTRVAIASAQGLAYGLGIDAVAVSTLAAVAASAGYSGEVLAILDARRSEVYAGRFRCELGSTRAGIEAVGAESVEPLSPLLEALGPGSEPTRIVGSGVEPYRSDLEQAGLAGTAMALPGPTAAGLWAAATSAWATDGGRHPAGLEAIYLRASYAEMGINAPKRPFVKSPFV